MTAAIVALEQEVLPPPNLRSATPRNRGRAGLGRPKGSVNKQTAIVKDALLVAAELAGRDVRPGDPEADGAVSYFRWLAVTEPSAFASLIGKVIPFQVQGDRENPLATHSVIEIKVVDPA